MHKYYFNLKFLNYFYNLKMIQMIQCSKSVEHNETFKKHHKPPKSLERHSQRISVTVLWRQNQGGYPSKQQIERGESGIKKQEASYQVFNQGYGLNALQKMKANQFQSQSEIMREQDLMKSQKKKLQADCKDIKKIILQDEEYLQKIVKKYKSEDEKEFQFGLQKTRIQNLRRLQEKEKYRLNKKEAMSSQDKQEISKEIRRICEMKITLIKKKEKKAFEEVQEFEGKQISLIFEKYLPQYKSLQFSENTVERSLRTFQKQSKIRAWINAEKQKRNQLLLQIQIDKKKVQQFEARLQKMDKQFKAEKQKMDKQFGAEKQKRNQILNLLYERKVQQFELQIQLRDAKNEDKKKIEIKLFKVSLNIKNLENQQKELQDKTKYQQKELQDKTKYEQKKLQDITKQAPNQIERLLKQIGHKQNQTFKSALQIEWEQIEKKRLQIQHIYGRDKQDAIKQRQSSLNRLAENFSFGNTIRLTNGEYIQSTRFFITYMSVIRYDKEIKQIKKFFQDRQQQSQTIKNLQTELNEFKLNYQITKNKVKQVEVRIINLRRNIFAAQTIPASKQSSKQQRSFDKSKLKINTNLPFSKGQTVLQPKNSQGSQSRSFLSKKSQQKRSQDDKK